MKKKNIRERGKIKLSRYFKKFKEGDRVAIVREQAVGASFSPRMQGRTGEVQKKRGKVYEVRVKDINKEKLLLVEPIHLKKIN